VSSESIGLRARARAAVRSRAEYVWLAGKRGSPVVRVFVGAAALFISVGTAVLAFVKGQPGWGAAALLFAALIVLGEGSFHVSEERAVAMRDAERRLGVYLRAEEFRERARTQIGLVSNAINERPAGDLDETELEMYLARATKVRDDTVNLLRSYPWTVGFADAPEFLVELRSEKGADLALTRSQTVLASLLDSFNAGLWGH
jgi:hypothetical protein